MKKFLFCLSLVLFTVPLLGQHLEPNDLDYLGAFRLPNVDGDVTWEFSGTAMTYYPGGDPTGPEDGFPGSLFIIGHDWYQYVSEISIPMPVISEAKEPSELNTATTLQPFGDIRSGLFGELEMPTVGLCYLPDSPGATQGSLYFCWGQHFQFHEPTHGYCGLDLADPQPVGPFYLGTANNYTTSDYMFTLPDNWAAAHTSGRNIATGRFREGQWSGLGPALYAFSPFAPEMHPASGDTILDVIPLLLYGQDDPTVPEIIVEDSIRMKSYSPADQWSGATWISAGNQAAVIFVGTKAMGNSWYGFGDGTVWPDEPPYPDVPAPPFDDRGWWCDSIRAQIIFYDPADLAAVAEGRLQTWEPQPYATLDINDVLFDPGFDFPRYKRWSLGAACFDKEHGHLFIIERRADEEKSLVHVWQVQAQSTGVETMGSARRPKEVSLMPNYPNPFNPSTVIRYNLPKATRVEIIIYNLFGQKIKTLVNERQTAGAKEVLWDGRNERGQRVSSGVYLYRIKTESFSTSRKMIMIK